MKKFFLLVDRSTDQLFPSVLQRLCIGCENPNPLGLDARTVVDEQFLDCGELRPLPLRGWQEPIAPTRRRVDPIAVAQAELRQGLKLALSFPKRQGTEMYLCGYFRLCGLLSEKP